LTALQLKNKDCENVLPSRERKKLNRKKNKFSGCPNAPESQRKIKRKD
jgi:hypothetical protein